VAEKKPIAIPESEIYAQFSKLPPDITGVVNAPDSIAAMQRLDDQYPTLNTAGTIIRVVAGVVSLSKLNDYLVNEQGVAPDAVPSLRASIDAILKPILPKLQPSVPLPAPVVPVAVPTPTAPITLPSHGFEHSDDAKEIAQHRESVTAMQAKPSVDANAVADTIAKDFDVFFVDPNLESRFRTIAISAMKGIRKPYDTRDLLSRSPKIGGLGLSLEVTEKLIVAFAAHAGELGVAAPAQLSASPVMPAPRVQAPVPSAPSVPLRSAPAQSVVAATAPVPPVNLPVQPPSPPPVPYTIPRPAPNLVQGREPSRPPLASPPAPVPTPFSGVVERAPRSSARPVVSDVRKPKRTVGPVDELGLLTVDDLRRLDRDPDVALTKVWGKFQSLAKESFALFAEGVKAWRHSPLYKLYVTMGTESMASGRAVDEVANARRIANQPTLTPNEFALIADFNRNLRL
jgi:hypothetical protein